ncbi:MAG: cadherin repeat domain-containing protein [Reichenbachiella sp.]|uniref:cadherin repeat domain-containing protein n=1 Tax=Reichenbachiella sp. TaxID=2184521 RepID=UPI0032636793
MKTQVYLLISILLWVSCSEDELNVEDQVEVTVEDFTATVNDSPADGEVIGTIDAETNLGSLSFSITSESIDGAFDIDESSGQLSVADASLFVYTVNELITGVVTVENGDVSKTVNLSVNVAGISAEELSLTIDENPTNEQELGTISATTNAGDFVFSIAEEEPAGALEIDASTGEVTVKDKLLFDFESREELTATISVEAGDVSVEVDVTIALRDVSSSWQTIGTAGFSAGKAHYQSIAVLDGVPYVAYRDEENDNKTTVMKYEDDEWQVVGTAGFSDGYATHQSLTFNNGIPYVAYRDDVNGRKTTVMKFENGSWQLVGSAGFAERSYAVSYTSEYQSLVFNDDVPYVAYKDWSRSAKITVMKFDGSDWVLVGTAGFSSGAASYVSLKFYNDIPYVAYQDAGNGSKVTVAKFETTDWSVVGTAGFSSVASYVDLIFDGSVPYVAFSDEDNNGKTTVMRYKNSSWSIVGTAAFSLSSAQYQSLAIKDDQIHVAFRDSFSSGKATVMKYNGSNWSPLGSVGFSDGNVNHLEMMVDNEIPFVVYRDDANNINKTTMMRYDDK